MNKYNKDIDKKDVPLFYNINSVLYFNFNMLNKILVEDILVLEILWK